MTDEQILSLYRDRGLDSEYIEVDIIGFARTIAAAERERCAKVCEDQKYMVLQPLRTYTAEEVCRSNKVTANYLAAAIRNLK